MVAPRFDALPRVGAHDADHARHLNGCAYSDLARLGADAGVQEVYVMDGFMRALCEFRSRQGERGVSVPVPCVPTEPLGNVKRRLLEAARANLEDLRRTPRAALVSRYGSAGSVRRYAWVDGEFFGDDWGEHRLQWFAYQTYAAFLEPANWRLVAPDLATELYDELKVSRAADAVAKHAAKHNLGGAGPGAAPSTSRNAIYLLPTRVRVLLFRDGYENLTYTLPRATTFEDLKARVEADLKAPGAFTAFAAGPPGNKFGPGKTLEDVLEPSAAAISHSWK